MTKSCCVWGCTSRKRNGVKFGFYCLPSAIKRPAQRRAWLLAIRRTKTTAAANVHRQEGGVSLTCKNEDWAPGKWIYVCQRHFVSGKPSRDPSHPDFVPNQLMKGVQKKSPKKSLLKLQRYERAKRRAIKVLTRQPVPNSSTEMPSESSEDTTVEDHRNGGSQKNSYVEMLEKEISALRVEKDKLQQLVQKKNFTFCNLADSDVKFYTSIENKAVFKWILHLVEHFFTERTVITIEDQLLLTLMKLRHALKNKDLAHRFGTSATTVSDVLNVCIPVLATRLGFLIKWPTDEEMEKNLPEKFKQKFSRCRVIIDCTEVFLDRPYNLTARAQTWSNYKHHHTLKALIGITPWGSVCFVSRLWGGRISDKEITEKSRFYSKIQPGDQVMCDRGFTITQELARRGASLVMPPFLLGKKQLSGRTVQHARQISALRIHVERAMERIKNFEILKHVMPVTLLPLSSQILFVCGALSNLQAKLIS